MLAGLDHSTSSCLVRGSRMVDILDECLPPPRPRYRRLADVVVPGCEEPRSRLPPRPGG